MEEKKTIRQTIKEELGKLSELSWKQRIEYIWDYYKTLLAAFAGFLFLLSLSVGVYKNSQINSLLQVYFLNCDTTDVISETIADEFGAFIGGLKNHDVIDIDTTLWLDEEGDDQFSMVSQTKLMAVSSAGVLDILFVPEYIYREYQKAGSLMDLSMVFSEEQMEKWADLFVYDPVPEGNGEAPYALLMEKTSYIQEHKIYTGDQHIYGMVYYAANHPELCDDFFEFLIG